MLVLSWKILGTQQDKYFDFFYEKGRVHLALFFAHTKLLEQPLGLCYAIGVLKKSGRDC